MFRALWVSIIVLWRSLYIQRRLMTEIWIGVMWPSIVYRPVVAAQLSITIGLSVFFFEVFLLIRFICCLHLSYTMVIMLSLSWIICIIYKLKMKKIEKKVWLRRKKKTRAGWNKSLQTTLQQITQYSKGFILFGYGLDHYCSAFFWLFLLFLGTSFFTRSTVCKAL